MSTWRSMSRPNQVTTVVVIAAILTMGAAIAYGLSAPRGSLSTPASDVVTEESHRLDDAGDDAVTVVEFLDFECEACGAAYPSVEELRERYAGRVTFVVRYFPLPGHTNAVPAAHAVEAAARQGRLEEMYTRMFRTQAEWGEAQESRADVFRGFAADLGLDLDRYDADVASASVADRVQRDVDAGAALGVTGTPTFFVDGVRIDAAGRDDVAQAIERALKSS